MEKTQATCELQKLLPPRGVVWKPAKSRAKREAKLSLAYILYSLMVRIRGFHPRDPGSIPGIEEVTINSTSSWL